MQREHVPDKSCRERGEMTLDVTYNARLRVIRVDFVVTLS